MRNWVDVREYFREFNNLKRRMNIKRSLDRMYYTNIQLLFRKKCNVIFLVLGLQFEGRLHSGLDDTKNISRILLHMIRISDLKPNDFVGNTAPEMRYRSRGINQR